MKTYLRSIPLSRFLIIWAFWVLSAQSLLKAQGIFREVFAGLTSQGGGSNSGVIFTWDPVTNAYFVKQDLPRSGPRGNLSLMDGKLRVNLSRGNA